MNKAIIGTLLIGSFLFVPLSTAEAKVTASKPKPTPTALCKDGTYSYSANHKGTCSYHKGVKVWYK